MAIGVIEVIIKSKKAANWPITNNLSCSSRKKMSKKENKLIPKSTLGQYRDFDRGDWSPLDCTLAEEHHPILDKF